jgi:hypothetical protein
MKKVMRKSVITVVALLFSVAIFAWLRFEGMIPVWADPWDVSDEKLCGIQPTSGRVWSASSGLGTGSAFFRFHKAAADYSAMDAVILTEANSPEVGQPWWWGAKPNGRVTILEAGCLGFDTKSYQIYDPDTEQLSVYCQWD